MALQYTVLADGTFAHTVDRLDNKFLMRRKCWAVDEYIERDGKVVVRWYYSTVYGCMVCKPWFPSVEDVCAGDWTYYKGEKHEENSED